MPVLPDSVRQSRICLLCGASGTGNGCITVHSGRSHKKLPAILRGMQFLFVRPRFCLRLLSDFASRRTPLSLADSSCCHACSGLSPPSYYAYRAHKNKAPLLPETGFVSDLRPAAQQGGISNIIFLFFLCLLDRGHIRLLCFSGKSRFKSIAYGNSRSDKFSIVSCIIDHIGRYLIDHAVQPF